MCNHDGVCVPRIVTDLAWFPLQELWAGDLSFAVMEDPLSATKPAQPATTADLARRHGEHTMVMDAPNNTISPLCGAAVADIFLDYVSMCTSCTAPHLLDTRFTSLRTPQETSLMLKVSEFMESLPDDVDQVRR